MPPNLAIDDHMIEEVHDIVEQGVKKTVTTALDECLQRRRQPRVLEYQIRPRLGLQGQAGSWAAMNVPRISGLAASACVVSY